MKELKIRILIIWTLGLLLFPLLSFFTPLVQAAVSTTPATPHDLNVLIIEYPDYLESGEHEAVLGRYGYNYTVVGVGVTPDFDYLTDSRTSDLSIYDIVMVFGHYTPDYIAKMTEAEVLHFMNYDGILLWSYGGYRNQTSNNWWSNWDASPITSMERRFGLSFSDNPNTNPENGTMHLQNSSFTATPSSLDVRVEGSWLSGFYIFPSSRVSLDGATEVYSLTSPSTIGITWYKNATGAVGIWFNELLYGWTTGADPDYIYHLCLLHDSTDRGAVIHSLISYSLGVDPETIIKPQPQAAFRSDDFPVWTGSNDTFSTNALDNSFEAAQDCDVPITYATLTYYCENFPNFWDRWKEIESSEYVQQGAHFNHTDWTTFTQEQCECLIDYFRADHDTLNIERFSVIIVPRGEWKRNTEAMRRAMNVKEVTLLEFTTSNNSIVDDGTLLHGAVHTASTPKLANRPISKILWAYKYSVRRQLCRWIGRGSWATVLNHLPAFYFPQQVGYWQVKTFSSNLTADVPDVEWVGLPQACRYFGNQWMAIHSASRSGNTVAFDVNVDDVQSVGGIGKGMLWIRINSNATIESVSINGSSWYMFNDYSIRIPAANSQIQVTLGTPTTPYIKESDGKVTLTTYIGNKLIFVVDSISGTRSITKVCCGGEGEPAKIKGADSVSYNSINGVLTLQVEHSRPEEITIHWSRKQKRI